jgi:quercetin dioxygenase-like cupin family protein
MRSQSGTPPGESIHAGPWLVTRLVTSEESEGQFSLVRLQGRQGAESLLHVHHGEAETVYVVHGEVACSISEGEEVYLRAGACRVFPAGTGHGLKVRSRSATMLVLFTPAGFDGYYADLAQRAAPSFEELVALAARYGCEYVSLARATQT